MRALVTALLAAVLISPLPASALELGPSRLLSAAGEPLNVEIPVLQAEADQLERLRPQLPARSRSANLAGATITFCLTFGDFIAPILVGGPDGSMISNVITSQYGTALNWPLGSALAILMLVIVLAIIEVSDRLQKSERISTG